MFCNSKVNHKVLLMKIKWGDLGNKFMTIKNGSYQIEKVC